MFSYAESGLNLLTIVALFTFLTHLFATFFRHILTDDDRNDLQCAVDALQNWSELVKEMVAELKC